MATVDMINAVNATVEVLKESFDTMAADNLKEGVNAGWLVLGGAIVFYMQAGFALVEAGSVRAKNVSSILLKNIVDASVGCLAWYLFGYAFAFGKAHDPNSFVGSARFALKDAPTIEYAMWFFQFTFSATSATIVSGAMAERVKFSAYLVMTGIMSGWVYPIVVHAAWSTEGWLSPFNDGSMTKKLGMPKTGVIDFAGSGVVHLTGGIMSLVSAWYIGPRKGRIGENGEMVDMPGHSIAMVTNGTLVLWFCWYAFNCVSTAALSGGMGTVAGRVAMTTTIGGAMGGLSSLVVGHAVNYPQWPLSPVLNGILTGLVAITAGCSVVEPWGAFVIGVTAGPVYFCGSWLVRKMGIDDPVDAVAVHGCGGIWALLLTGCLATNKGLTEAYGITDPDFGGAFTGGNGKLLGFQALFMVFVILWAGSWALLLVFLVDKAVGLRITAEEEEEGLDSHHGDFPGYDYVVCEKRIELLVHQVDELNKKLGITTSLEGSSNEPIQPLP